MSGKKFALTILEEHNHVINEMLSSDSLLETIHTVAEEIVGLFRTGNALLLCGNGGSASDAQHIATEFVCRFVHDRRALNAEALNINASSLTAIPNDYSFDKVFSRQVEAKGRKSDMLIGLTTSGKSENVINAFIAARNAGMRTVCFTGKTIPKNLLSLCDHIISIPSGCTARIQECHIIVGHIICEYVEKKVVEET